MGVDQLAAALSPKHRPPLDTGFVPAWLWRREYARLVDGNTGSIPLVVSVVQPGGNVFRFDAQILPEEPAFEAINLRYLERMVKFLLWSRGGSRILISGAPDLVRHLRALYSPRGAREFDASFLGERIYLEPFDIVACAEASLPEEIPWDPYFQQDSDYHYQGIQDSLRRAAAHLPRVDAIGGSAAGVYVDNEPRVASLFRGVSDEVFADRGGLGRPIHGGQ